MMIKFAEMIFYNVYTSFIKNCRNSRRRFETFQVKINSRNCEKCNNNTFINIFDLSQKSDKR